MSYEEFLNERIRFWNKNADLTIENVFHKSYHFRINQIYQILIPRGSRVLEIGCGNGDLLAFVKPSYGVGIDFSKKQIELAKKRHDELDFYCVDIMNISSVIQEETFDYIILSDIVNDLWDIQSVFQVLKDNSNSRTRLIINFYSRLWQPILSLSQYFGLSKPTLQQNWITKFDLSNLLHLSDFEALKSWQEILFPLHIPIVNYLFNKVLVKIPPFNQLALSNFMLARLKPNTEKNYSVSVIVPARNEAGNIMNILERVPEMGLGTEIIFIEGNSSDNTYQKIEEVMKLFPERKILLLKQDGKGKGDAVRKGFKHATGNVLMILDADLTVPPEDLPRFYEALTTNKGEFINGVRLVYPMEKHAMRPINFIGNKFFSMAFSYLLGQPIKDTLCGTKVLFKEDYEKIVANRSYFGDFDPFGDYDLLFGASKIGLKIVDLPIRYQERIYGTTNIHRWRHGWLLLKMIMFAARRIKFV